MKETINPFAAPACKTSGLRSAHTHACKRYIRRSCNKSTFITAYFDRNLFTCSSEGWKGLNDFKCGFFIGRFESDGAASVAVKGLIKMAPQKVLS